MTFTKRTNISNATQGAKFGPFLGSGALISTLFFSKTSYGIGASFGRDVWYTTSTSFCSANGVAESSAATLVVTTFLALGTHVS
jgi:hypothetical protein